MLRTSAGNQRQYLISAGLTVLVLTVVYAAIANLGRTYVHSITASDAFYVTASLAAGGVLLAVVVRLASGYDAMFREWTNRSLVGALLLTPAALLLTRAFLAENWNVANCGTLLHRFRPAEANLAGFRAACDTAATTRLILLVIWAVLACAAAVGYGLRLRARRKFDRSLASAQQ